MTREAALEIAKANYPAHRKSVIDALFGRAPAVNEFENFGYRHGWYYVGDFCFCQTEVTGEPYDHSQGGWAYA